jgi:mRNA interferase MazF
MSPFGDLLVCAISTQLRQQVLGFDEIIERGDDDFEQSGLLATSLIRLGFLGVVADHDVAGGDWCIRLSATSPVDSHVVRVS